MNFPNPHAGIDAANYERDRRTASALRSNPALLEIARENLRRWMSSRDNEKDRAFLEWKAIMDFLSVREIADFLESRSPKSNRLRQSSPFVGIASRLNDGVSAE